MLTRSVLVFALFVGAPFAQESNGADPHDRVVEDMRFEDYDPPSTLVVKETEVLRAKYPFVDVHNHQWAMASADLDALTAEMDRLNMAVMVNLSGRARGQEGYIAAVLDNVARHQPDRFLVFTNISFDTVDEGWTERTVQQVRDDVALGAAGLKIYKSLGLSAVDATGARIAVDDPRLDPVWAVCGELGVPVLIHTAEPAAFWLPRDENNERWLELKQRPERYRPPGEFPTWEQLMAEQRRIFERHPDTVFVAAHLDWMGNDLDRLGELLDACPNVYTEIGAVLAELGRQPRTARRWFERYQDRVLFGKDTWVPSEYPVYFRTLETDDEYFPYYRRRHAFWRLYGLELPDVVLRKLYYGNALRLFPQLDASRFPPIDG